MFWHKRRYRIEELDSEKGLFIALVNRENVTNFNYAAKVGDHLFVNDTAEYGEDVAEYAVFNIKHRIQVDLWVFDWEVGDKSPSLPCWFNNSRGWIDIKEAYNALLNGELERVISSGYPRFVTEESVENTEKQNFLEDLQQADAVEVDGIFYGFNFEVDIDKNSNSILFNGKCVEQDGTVYQFHFDESDIDSVRLESSKPDWLLTKNQEQIVVRLFIVSKVIPI